MMHPNMMLFALFSSVVSTNSLKILGIFIHPGKSHMLVFQPILTALSERGHQVTVISHFPLENPRPNYTDISLKGTSRALVEVLDMQNDDFPSERWHVMPRFLKYGRETCENAYKSQAVQSFLKEKHDFDVILIEFFNRDCFLGLVHKLAKPFLGVSSCNMPHWYAQKLAQPTNPSYIPNWLLDFKDKMTFLERTVNTLGGMYQAIFYGTLTTWDDEEIMREHVEGDIPVLDDLRKNASLVFVNTHFSLHFPRANVPGVVEIGGVHLGEAKQLPQDLEKWINESAHGVIYFSLGSMIKGHTFPEEQRQAFLRAFARLPQRVLWKWETDTMPGKPDNVMIQKWMPQLDILSHPNVKAFISHGGLLGMTEAVHCGVPAVVMPQYGDQFTNAKALEANGGGVILNLREATEEKVYNALKTILDPNFRKGAQELSARFRDRPLPPLETAIYWVEYVARHRGAHHMRTAAVDMPFYKYFLLDVIAFLLLVFGTIAACMFYITRLIVRKIFGGKSQAAKVKTN